MGVLYEIRYTFIDVFFKIFLSYQLYFHPISKRKQNTVVFLFAEAKLMLCSNFRMTEKNGIACLAVNFLA